MSFKQGSNPTKTISKGGESKIDNLRTLCGMCNMGRGDLMLDIEVKDKQNQNINKGDTT